MKNKITLLGCVFTLIFVCRFVQKNPAPKPFIVDKKDVEIEDLKFQLNQCKMLYRGY